MIATSANRVFHNHFPNMTDSFFAFWSSAEIVLDSTFVAEADAAASSSRSPGYNSSTGAAFQSFMLQTARQLAFYAKN
jgi:hypothetical protein